MCIDRIPCIAIDAYWARHPEDRYVAHPPLRLAFVQLLAEPAVIYVVSDQPLPETFERAVVAIEEWRVASVQAVA